MATKSICSDCTAAGKKRRGFASMDPEKQRALAASGGRASHLSGKGHRWTSEEAAFAGRKGGQNSKRGPARPKNQPAS